MNQDIAQGNWKQLSGKIKQKWGKLTDDDLLKAKGDKEYLVGRLHEQYGIAKDKVEDELQSLGYREDDQDVDLRSSDRSAAGRMDASGHGSAGSKAEKLNASSQRQDAGSSSLDMDSGDSQESGSRSFRQEGGGAGHTLEASPDKPQRSGSNSPGNQSGSGSRNPSEKSSQQQKSGRNTPGSGSGNH
jgi:uncharacterized protein YjbJ (UPF0337 family)